MTSIRLSLLRHLIVPLFAINLLGAGLTYWLAWAPTQIAWDQSLADAAWALIPRLREIDNQIEIDLPKQAEQILRVDHLDTIYFVVRDKAGKTIAGDKDFPAFKVPTGTNETRSDDAAMRGEAIRIIALKTNIGASLAFISVAETLHKRHASRTEILFSMLLLESLLTVASVAFIWYAVTKGLFPLKKMQTDLNARHFDDLSPVSKSSVPLELGPVVYAINGLLDKMKVGSTAQQNFLANVAHQLRTPLAGLKTQLEWLLQKYAQDKETADSAHMMLLSTERMVRQTNQLLALARAEPSRFETFRLEPVELSKLVEQSIQYFVEESDKKKIDLGFNLQATRVLGDHFLLRDLIDNVIDNAIRYAPAHGTVTVMCYPKGEVGVFSVEDSGPGIPTAERKTVFDRFYRLNDFNEGTGLGLAIVRDIAKDHGAEIILESGTNDMGTRFSVQFRSAVKFSES